MHTDTCSRRVKSLALFTAHEPEFGHLIMAVEVVFVRVV